MLDYYENLVHSRETCCSLEGISPWQTSLWKMIARGVPEKVCKRRCEVSYGISKKLEDQLTDPVVVAC